MNCLGEAGPGCSAHAEGCDGSTGTQRIVGFVSTIFPFLFRFQCFPFSNFLFQSLFFVCAKKKEEEKEKKTHTNKSIKIKNVSLDNVKRNDTFEM